MLDIVHHLDIASVNRNIADKRFIDVFFDVQRITNNFMLTVVNNLKSVNTRTRQQQKVTHLSRVNALGRNIGVLHSHLEFIRKLGNHLRCRHILAKDTLWWLKISNKFFLLLTIVQDKQQPQPR
jgi:hypothetical protein